jgi:hypothetical protein
MAVFSVDTHECIVVAEFSPNPSEITGFIQDALLAITLTMVLELRSPPGADLPQLPRPPSGHAVLTTPKTAERCTSKYGQAFMQSVQVLGAICTLQLQRTFFHFKFFQQWRRTLVVNVKISVITCLGQAFAIRTRIDLVNRSRSCRDIRVKYVRTCVCCSVGRT